MGRRFWLFGLILVGLAAAAGPLQVSAEGHPLASPTPRPPQRVTAPVISGENPEVYLSEGEQGDITPSDVPGPFPAQLPELVPNPDYRDLSLPGLPVAFQGQLGEVDCGPASLAMALSYLNQREGGSGLSTLEVSTWLEKRGLVYEWGTGVEELAFAAQNHGYPGSTPIHGWSLEQLASELRSGRPVPVALGSSGPDQPGHFLTVTGISPDGTRVFGLDPGRGPVDLSVEEFTALWGLQGNSAVLLRNGGSVPEADHPLPLMGLVSVVSALALAIGLREDKKGSGVLKALQGALADPLRQGIGGGVQLPSSTGVEASPLEREEQPASLKAVQVEVPIYETRQVQVGLRGIKVEVPVYETRKIFAGLRRETRQVPIYGIKKVVTGLRWVEKTIPVTRYRTQKVWTWKKITERVPVTRKIHGKSIVVGYRDQTRWRRVQVVKQVPYQSTKKLLVQEPVYSYQRVQTGTRTVTRWVPSYREQQVQVGTKTVHQTVPIYETRRVQVGTRAETRLVPVNGDGMRTPVQDPGEEGDPGDPARDLRLVEKLLADPRRTSPPTGISREVWDSLSEGDQSRIRSDGLDWMLEQIEFKKISSNRIFEAYKIIRMIREKIINLSAKLGFQLDQKDLPHLVSVSAQVGYPINFISQDSALVDTYIPPNLMSLFYFQQNIVVGDKVIYTVFPEGIVDFNLSSGSWSLKVGGLVLFSSLIGEVGYAVKLNSTKYDERWQRTSWFSDSNKIYIKYQQEGVNWTHDFINDEIRIKNEDYISCTVTVINKKAVAVVISLAVLTYLLFTSGIGVNLPAWQELIHLPI